MLRLIDRLELSEEDPERLASLFQMDHLVTRMRRDSDSALVLAGDETRHHPAGPVPLVDVLRAAVSEIEQYDRINLNVQQGFSVSGRAAVNTVHLLAELLENATTSSARTMQVDVCAQKVRDGGVLVTITDGGRAMSQERLRQLNTELAQPPADGAFPQHVGLSAVAQLAARHGLGVMLKAGAGRPYHRRGASACHPDLTGRRARRLAAAGGRSTTGCAVLGPPVLRRADAPTGTGDRRAGDPRA